MWMTRIEIKSYWDPVNHLKDRHDVRIWNMESYTTSSLKDKNLLQSAQFTSQSPHARSIVAGWPWTQRVHYPSNSLRLTEGFHINLTAAALRTHEKPLQMTGSLHTNTQRRPRNISQTLVSFGLHSELAGSFGKHLVDGSGGGDPNSVLGRCRARTLQPYSFHSIRDIQMSESPAESRAKQPSVARAQNEPGGARKSRLELDGGLGWLR